jgi:hypothetical protein
MAVWWEASGDLAHSTKVAQDPGVGRTWEISEELSATVEKEEDVDRPCCESGGHKLADAHGHHIVCCGCVDD